MTWKQLFSRTYLNFRALPFLFFLVDLHFSLCKDRPNPDSSELYFIL